MTRKFFLDEAPITAADIGRECELAEKTIVRSRKRDIGFLIYAIIMVPSVLSFQLLVVVPAVQNPDTLPGIIGIIVLYTPYIIGIVFFSSLTVYHKMVEKPRKLAKQLLIDLKETTPEEQAEVLSSGQPDADILAYQQKVAAMGRGLVRGELDAFQRRLDKLRAAA